MDTLGISLGAFTQEYGRQREQKRQDAAEGRQQQQFDMQMQEAERLKAIRGQRESAVRELQGYKAALSNPADPNNFTLLQQGAQKYGIGKLERMGNSIGVFAGGEQGVPQFRPLDPNKINAAILDQLALADADQAMPYLQGQAKDAKDDYRWGITNTREDRKLSLEESYKNRYLDIMEAEKAANERYRMAALARSGAGGGGRGGADDGLSQEEQSTMMSLWQAYETAQTPEEKARAAQAFDVFKNRVAVTRGKFPAFSANTTRAPSDPEAQKAYYEYVKNNPEAPPQQVRLVKQNLGLPVEPSRLDLILERELGGGPEAEAASSTPQQPHRFVQPGFLGMGGTYKVFDPRFGVMDAEDYARRTGNSMMDLPLGNPR